MQPQTTAQRSFRLPGRTLTQLDALVELGVGKSGTEAVIIAIEHLATEYQASGGMLRLLKLLSVSDDGKELIRSICNENKDPATVTLSESGY
jgi:Arc/MetJ-type ribon-helix-helix transcriptional regulator